MSVLLLVLIAIAPAILVGLFARSRGRIFFGAFLASFLLTPIGGLIYCFVVPQLPFEKHKDTALLADLLVANIICAVLLFLPLGGGIESDFQNVFGERLGTVICGLYDWAPVLVLGVAVPGNYLGLGRVNRMRHERGAPTSSRFASVITLTWAFLLVLRVALLVTLSW